MRRAVYTGPLTLVGGPAARPRVKPTCLLADSTLLFHERGALVRRLAAMTENPAPRAAYLGASNGDEPAFYDVFRAAFEPAGVTDLRMIPAAPSPDDLAFLAAAHVVVLAGGDVERGWRAMRAGGLADAVIGRWTEGAVLVGISAGAVQLGTWAWPDLRSADAEPLATFGIVPFAVAAHEEASGWREMDALLRALGPGVRGLGIPSGGGALVDPDGTVHPLRRPVVESTARVGGIATRRIEAQV